MVVARADILFLQSLASDSKTEQELGMMRYSLAEAKKRQKNARGPQAAQSAQRTIDRIEKEFEELGLTSQGKPK